MSDRGDYGGNNEERAKGKLKNKEKILNNEDVVFSEVTMVAVNMQ